MGGLIGRISRGWLRIDTLWVDETCRGKGLGKELILKAESIGKTAGCHSVRLDTYSFQSHKFYHKFGYEEFARLDIVPEGEVHYFLKKQLSSHDH